MAEYIEREALLEKAQNERIRLGYDIVSVRDIESMPAADVAPVRHGRWIDKPTGRYRQWQAWCSVCDEKCGCGGTIKSQHKMFCPNCGAKMDLEG